MQTAVDPSIPRLEVQPRSAAPVFWQDSWLAPGFLT